MGQKNIVYKITNILNGDFYIGITCQRFCHRKAQHIFSAFKGNSKAHIHRAMRKYGRENFEFSIIKTCETYEECGQDEFKMIQELKPHYNEAKGGLTSFGWKHKPESLKIMSEKHKGKIGYWKGKKLLPNVVEHLRNRNNQPEAKERWSSFVLLGSKSLSKKVVCLDDGNVFDSVMDAARFYDLDGSSISEVCRKNGLRKTVARLVFRYWGDHFGGKEEADEVKRLVYDSRVRCVSIARDKMAGILK